MSTQNVQSANQMRSSGHKDATEHHSVAHKLGSRAEGGDLEALLNSRLLSNDNVSRAAIYDNADFLCVGSSVARFKLEPDDVRKVYDGLLTSQRQGDPTMANVGEAPKSLGLGQEGRADVQSFNADRILATLNGKSLIAGQTAKHVFLVESTGDAPSDVVLTLVQSFQDGLQELTM